MRAAHIGIPALLLCSGAAALADEVLWARDFALLYGITATGTAVVLAAYFGGLALGSLLGGSLGERTRGLRAWAAFEGGVALSVLAYLALRPGLPAAAAWAARTPLPGARVLLAFGVLLVPTTLLGATLPAAAAALAPGDGPGAGRLYAWNTLGGVLGALAAGTLLVRGLGVRGAFVAAALVDLAVAGGALVLARRLGPSPPASAGSGGGPARQHAAMLAAAATGAGGLAAEVLWTRGLAGVLSSSVYSIAIVLAAVLLGLVIGAGIAARWLRLTGAVAPRLAAVEVGIAIAVAASLLALRALPAASLALIRWLAVTGPGTGLALEAGLALAVVLVPATLYGAAFPLALALAGLRSPPAALGRVLAANTLGAIAGALGGAFVLLPGLGLSGGLLAVATMALAVAAGLSARPAACAAVAVVALLAVAAPPLRLPWRAPANERLLFYRDGAAATVTVTEDARGLRRLRVNGQYSLGGGEGLLLEAREAHLPLLLHPSPERMLALGVGTADTIGAAIAHPGLVVDAVELVPEVLAAARFFAAQNHGVLDNPRAHLVVDDARSFLLASDARWDVILSDLFLPWTAGTAALYTVDFYRRGRAHLRPGGLYCQWLPLHQLAVADLEAIVASFVAAFPHVQLWVAYHRTTTPLAALVGSAEALRPDATAIDARLAAGDLARAASAVGLADASDLAPLYVTDGRHLRVATAGTPPLTDDRPRLEFTAPAAYFHQQDLARAALAWVAARLDPSPSPLDARASFALRAALLSAQLALLAGDRPAELAAYADALTAAPTLRAPRAALGAIAAERRAAGDETTARRIAALLDARARGLP